jgi:hypothetical protein
MSYARFFYCVFSSRRKKVRQIKQQILCLSILYLIFLSNFFSWSDVQLVLKCEDENLQSNRDLLPDLAECNSREMACICGTKFLLPILLTVLLSSFVICTLGQFLLYMLYIYIKFPLICLSNRFSQQLQSNLNSIFLWIMSIINMLRSIQIGHNLSTSKVQFVVHKVLNSGIQIDSRTCVFLTIFWIIRYLSVI